ncbi:MAG: GspE/PulE family protein [bacterium]
MFYRNKQKFEDYLLEKNIISKDIYKQFNAGSYNNIDKFIIDNKFIDEEGLLKIKANFLNLEYADLSLKKIDYDFLHIIPHEVAENYKIICFNKSGNEIDVGFIDFENFKAIEAVDFLAKENSLKVKYFLISKNSFEIAIRQYKTLKKEVNKLLDIADEEHAKEEELEKEGEQEVEGVIKGAPVSKMVSVILRHAVEGGASDIHIEPSGDKTRVRYRIDGMLGISLILPSYIHSTVVARIKILSNLKIDETRIPQDGRMRLIVDNKTIDFRISTMPLMGKEKVVMRILDTSGGIFTLEQLGFSERQIKIINKNIEKPNGITLLTGPTGSGKSTTLYAVLNILNKESVNIITLEDPVEYTMEGVNQSQINPAINYTFATGLRTILRQDPNIVMVGEIRDNETAELAMHAALTGHAVLSTIHTNDATGTIPRLLDMKAEPFLLSSTLNAILAQRLIRKICANCKEEITVSDELENEIRSSLKEAPICDIPKGVDLNSGKKLVFYRGKGCSKCNNSGYKGRSVIAEVLDVTDNIKKIIAGRFQDIDKIKVALKEQNMLTVKQDGFIKALEGKTSLEEVFRVTKE